MTATATKRKRPLKPGQEPIHRKSVPKTPAAAQAATECVSTEAVGADEELADLRDDAAAPSFYEKAIAIADVVVPKGNPRERFDDAELDELAQTIRAHGLIQPIVVREVLGNGKFELVAGERRLRAAKRLAHKTILARVGILTGEEADEIRLLENLARQDLTAIEEARGLAALLRRHGYTQEKLAERIGRSQPHVANRLRLLKLPEKWQRRIISGEIPASHGRALVEHAQRPKILKAVADQLRFGCPSNYKEFEDLVVEMADGETRPLEGKAERWSGELGRHPTVFKPTDDQRKKLDVIDVDGKQRAANTKLWDQLQASHVQRLIDNAGKGKKAKAAANGKPRELTPAEKKAAKRDHAKQFAKRLAAWRTNWLREILGRWVLEDPNLALAVVLVKLSANHGATAKRERIAELVRFDGKATASRGYGYHTAPGLLAAMADQAEPLDIIVQLASEWLWDGAPVEGWQSLDPEEVEALATAAGVDLREAWQTDLAGPLTTAYFNLHTKDQLEGLAKELGVKDPAGDAPVTKASIVELLERSERTAKRLPAEIKPVAAAKKTPAKKRRPR